MRLTLILAAAAVSLAAAPAPPTIIGTWRTPVDGGTVRVEACAALICGHVESSAVLATTPDQRDVLNSDPAQRGRPIKGLLMLQLRPEEPGKWGDGWIYDPRRGQTFKASAEVTADGRLLLTGCAAPLRCRTQTWTRVR